MPRTSLNTSRLVRVLSELVMMEVADSRQSFAERLGQWLDFTDAMALFSVLKGNPGGASGAQADTEALRGHAVQAEFVRVRSDLLNSISLAGTLQPGRVRIKLPTPALNAPVESAAEFLPYHRYYLAHQRDMNASIAQLRASARAALACRSPKLRQLAALDAALENALTVRERNLLSTVPLILAKRHEHLYKAHREMLADTPADDPERWMQAGGWLEIFCRDMQAVLRAELDVRLQPVTGLVEALGNEVTK